MIKLIGCFSFSFFFCLLPPLSLVLLPTLLSVITGLISAPLPPQTDWRGCRGGREEEEPSEEEEQSQTLAGAEAGVEKRRKKPGLKPIIAYSNSSFFFFY